MRRQDQQNGEDEQNFLSRGSLFGVEIGLEVFSQVGPGAEEQAFDGGQGKVEDLANLIVRHVFVAAEDHGEALFLREFLNGGINGLNQFLLQSSLVRSNGGVILGGDVVGFLVGLHGYLAFPVALARFVKDEIARDGEEPGRELGFRLVAVGGFPDAHENLLGEVLGIVSAAHHLRNGADHGRLMFLDELLEGVKVARFGLKHERDIDRIVVGRDRRRVFGLMWRVFLRGHESMRR
jgi:hypothetical protein